ncbi:DNA polymerase beta superfamily protein [Leucobacter sp. cx-169]|uniref:DNA polymerase beta superfamily protein n=1 Tax=Leucobacter sp. cx-169 TaxID=2770549 RepID=UPI00165E25AA|nr:nucleotidyltransferase domain-containing protein [Leucobacter sp. cx-169]MBC9927171.1 nucleotidyltransferase domain-containing protein [Leucobacter sp. cx-169]
MQLDHKLEVLDAVAPLELSPMMLVEYGSRAYGTATDQSDHDLLGVFVESDAELYGLDTAATCNFRLRRDGRLEKMGVSANEAKSAHDVVEMHFHPLRKYVSLAAAGNPTVLSTLWTDLGGEDSILAGDAAEKLTANRDLFLSKHAAYRHAGYARSQREAMLGLSNQRTSRPDLVEAHGYDVKYASHMIRILISGLDLVHDRTYHLPMKDEHLELLREIRDGQYSCDDAVAMSEKLEHDLVTAAEDSSLPESVDFTKLNALLKEVRHRHFGALSS